MLTASSENCRWLFQIRDIWHLDIFMQYQILQFMWLDTEKYFALQYKM